MWVTRMSSSSSLLSVDHREPEAASLRTVAPHSEGDGEAFAAQQATITQGSTTPVVQDGDDSIAGAPLPEPSITLGASS
jgi:hypothetical protein